MKVAVALGSNLGDRRAHLTWAVAQLRRHISNLRVSSFIETDPVGVDGPQPAYFNAAAVGETDDSADALLDALLSIERARGRTRPSPNAPRTLDLDLILYGAAVIDGPGLVVPHPRFRTRRFVLAPLVELEPEWKDPVTGCSMEELLEQL